MRKLPPFKDTIFFRGVRCDSSELGSPAVSPFCVGSRSFLTVYFRGMFSWMPLFGLSRKAV